MNTINKKEMEQIEKGKTAKFLRDTKGVSEKAKENLKEFNTIKKTLLSALTNKELTIKQLSEQTNMTRHEVMYYLMCLVKYDLVIVGQIDDMDEYYTHIN